MEGRRAGRHLAAALTGIACAVAAAMQSHAGAAQALTPIQLPDGRLLTPAGTMVGAGDFPDDSLLSGGTLFVADAGEGPNLVGAFDATTLAATFTTPHAAPSTGYAPWTQAGSLAMSPGGSTLYASGGASSEVVELRAGPAPEQTGTVAVTDAGGRSTYAGAVRASGDGTHLYVTEPYDSSDRFDKGSVLARVDVTGGAEATVTVGSTPDALAVAAVAPLGGGAPRELVAVGNRDSGSVSVVDGTSMTVLDTVVVGRQPAALAFTPDGTTLLVANSLDDTLVGISTSRWAVAWTVHVGAAQLGAMPSAIAVTPDGSTAYVALSAENALAVVTLGTSPALAGLIPTAAYPTSVAVDESNALGPTLLVTSGKGTGQETGAPPGEPVAAVQPLAPGPTGLGVAGVVESIPLPGGATLSADTAQVVSNDRLDFSCTPSPALAQVKHVVYIIRENKTYDEEFGDMPGGDPAGLLYGSTYTPNAHALASRFALLEDFYADEEVSDTGHQAVMGGVANDWVERLSQQAYGLDGAPRQGAELGDDSDVLWSPSDYLLDSALATGIDFRDYGEFYRRDQVTDGPVSRALGAHIVTGFPHFGFDPGFPDTQRIAYWRQQFEQDVSDGTFPSLEVIYLPEDHTTDGAPLPQDAQQVADSDLATGEVVDAVSHSPYWGSTAIFLTEDDPQSGVDHVDEHRTVGLVVGPMVQPGVQSTDRYDQVGMLRTIEEILGLPPLTQFDATAQPMDALFTTAGDTSAYSAATPAPPPGGASASPLRPYDAVTPHVVAPTPTVAAGAETLRASLGVASGRADDIAPGAQLGEQWFEQRGTPYAPPHWTAHGEEMTATRGATPPSCAPSTNVAESPTGAAWLLLAAVVVPFLAVRRLRSSRARR